MVLPLLFHFDAVATSLWLKLESRLPKSASSMPFPPWSHDLELGVPEIDHQHRLMAELLHTLNESVAGGVPRIVVQRLLSDLSALLNLHFRHEEELMGRLNHAFSTEHTAEHSRILHLIAHCQEEIRHRALLAGDPVLSFLKSWMLDHVVGRDRVLIEDLRLQQVEEQVGAANLRQRQLEGSAAQPRATDQLGESGNRAITAVY